MKIAKRFDREKDNNKNILKNVGNQKVDGSHWLIKIRNSLRPSSLPYMMTEFFFC